MMTTHTQPLLSICIPTYNRADLLEDALASLRPEVISLGEAVEVVVSDNCSSDSTADVLLRNSDWVRHSRSEQTTPFAMNMLRVACDLARGRFIWLVGDDDLVIRGAVTRVLESLVEHPEIAYHYLNFGWLNVAQRHQIIHELDSSPALFPARPGAFQSDEFNTLILPRIEDLAFLPGWNPSALFSGFFCFVAHRELFLRGRARLHPSDNPLAHDYTAADDTFPHAVITLPQMAGKPVVYIGQPCVLQGTGAWGWAAYVNKTMIFSTHQFFSWLSDTDFAPDGLAKLWESYYVMAGRLFCRMLYHSDEHQGIEFALQEAIPAASGHPLFWESFKAELQTDYDANDLAVQVKRMLDASPGARIGLLGVGGTGLRLVKTVPEMRTALIWAADDSPALHGVPLQGTSLVISKPDTLPAAELDCLVIADGNESVQQTVDRVAPMLKPGCLIVHPISPWAR